MTWCVGAATSPPAMHAWVDTALVGLVRQPGDRLLVDRVQAGAGLASGNRRLVTAIGIELNELLGHHVSHRCQSP